MKWISFIIVFSFSVVCSAQVIENPVFDRTDNYVFHVNKVEIGKSSTCVYCTLNVPKGSWANFSPNAYIEDVFTKKKYTIIKCEGIPFSPLKRNFYNDTKCEVVLFFPSLNNASKVNIIDTNNGGFNIYGINLNKSYNQVYSDPDYVRLTNMTKFWLSAGDSTKALDYKKKEIEASKYLFGEKSSLYISGMNQLADMYRDYGDNTNYLHWRGISANTCREICNVLVDDASKQGAIMYYLQDIDLFFEKQVTAFQFFFDNKKWQEAKHHAQNVYQILHDQKDAIQYVSIIQYYIGLASYYAKDEADAEKYYLMSYDSFQKHAESKQYPVYGELLNGMSLLFYVKGDYNKAYQYASESCNIYSSISGINSKEYAFALTALSNAELMLNMKEEGLSHAELASTIIEKANDVLNDVKEVYRKRLYAIKNNCNDDTQITSKIESPIDNIAVAIFEANNDALSGKLDSAIEKFYKIREYQEQHFENVDLPNYIYVIVTLADALTQTGHLTEADNILDGTISMLQKHQIATNLVRHIYCSKGMLYYTLKDNLSAIQWYNKALDLFHQVKDNGISYARLLNNISLINIQIGNYKDANEQIEKAIDICSRFYNESDNNSDEVFLLMNNLGTNYVKMGNIDKGIEIYTSIITDSTSYRNIRTKALAMNNLAEIYISKGDYEKAKSLLVEVTTLDVDGYIKDLADFNFLICLFMEKDMNAVDRLNTFNQNTKRNISTVFGRFSESEREAYWAQWSQALVFLNNLAVTTLDSPKTKRMAYDNALFTKGMLLNSGRLLENIVKKGDGKLKESYEMMQMLKEKLSNKGNSKDSIEFYLQRINSIEKQIISLVPNFDERLISQFKSFKDVKNQLSDNDVAIEFIFLPQLNMPIEKTQLLYGALILTKNDDAPKLVLLCGDKELDEFIRFSQSNINDLYSVKNKRLYEMVWQSIEPFIPEGANIYYSPTGDISKINLSAISDGTSRLMDRFNIYEVSSTALIDKIRQSVTPQVHSAVIYGNIDYYTDTDTMAKISSSYKLYSSEPLMATRSLYRNTWDLLPGTEKEIVQITDILKGKGIQVQLLSHSAANEESFKALNACSPNIIHIATHGFYFPNKKDAKSNFFSDLKSNTYNDCHLFYSGLLFSGANNVWTGEKIATEVEDGILTANEISHLDLSNVSLAVLSACETGLGDISKVDGVYGLQRGLKRAGVETILMSLWKVDDEATQILMVEFYRNLMSGKTKHQSLKDAQMYLRQVNNGKYDDPQYWASFIMLDGLN